MRYWMHVLLSYREIIRYPTWVLDSQLIDSKSILTNKNPVFSFTLKYVWLTYANHNFLFRVLVRYSNRLAKETKILLRSWLIDYCPRYAIFYVN